MAGYLTRLAAQTGLAGAPAPAAGSSSAPVFEESGDTSAPADGDRGDALEGSARWPADPASTLDVAAPSRAGDSHAPEPGRADGPTQPIRPDPADPEGVPSQRAADPPEPSVRHAEDDAGSSPDPSVSGPADSEGGARASRGTVSGAAESPARGQRPGAVDGETSADRTGATSSPEAAASGPARPALEPPGAGLGRPAVDRREAGDPLDRKEPSPLTRPGAASTDREAGEASWMDALSRARRWVAGTEAQERSAPEESARSADPVEPAPRARSDFAGSARSPRSVEVPGLVPAIQAHPPAEEDAQHARRSRDEDVSVSIGSIEVRVEAPAESSDGGAPRAGADGGAGRRPADRRHGDRGDGLRLDRHYIWT